MFEMSPHDALVPLREMRLSSEEPTSRAWPHLPLRSRVKSRPEKRPSMAAVAATARATASAVAVPLSTTICVVQTVFILGLSSECFECFGYFECFEYFGQGTLAELTWKGLPGSAILPPYSILVAPVGITAQPPLPRGQEPPSEKITGP